MPGRASQPTIETDSRRTEAAGASRDEVPDTAPGRPTDTALDSAPGEAPDTAAREKRGGAPAEKAGEVPAEKPGEVPAEKPGEAPAEKPGETPGSADGTRLDHVPLEALTARLDCGTEGLSSGEAAQRLERYGPNAVEERRASPLKTLLGFFWGPIPWMIEVAAVLSAVVGHWTDLVIIVAMLLLNAAIGFWHEFQAANAVEALKEQLAVRARVRRDGAWSNVDATTLVPGDLVRVRLGDIVPADLKLLEGDYLSLDQSALTGESLPAQAMPGWVAYAGSIVRQGEMTALVAATGGRTFFGRTASLVATAQPTSHFQKAVLAIGDYLIMLSLGLVSVLLVVELLHGTALLTLVQFALILTVASIPVAMPAVLSVTMAIGARELAGQKAIVARLEAIEEMAGMDLLFSDKTGTLTQNRLELGEPVVVDAADASEVLAAAALASDEANADAIDEAVLAGARAAGVALDGYERLRSTPFDPVHKRSEAQLRAPDGRTWRVSKGAPQAVLHLATLEELALHTVQAKVGELAVRGLRTLAVARSVDDEPWTLLGLLSLSDPPRADSARTIAEARDHGVTVKMVTGDNLAIGREIAGQLGMGTDLLPAGDLFGEGAAPDADAGSWMEDADGFAEVFPEHKFRVVKAAQARGHIVGMTGDGVNDAPALKQADVGIAVSGATDAARAAADLVLTAPGLGVIVRAVEEARRIFERMMSYTIYRITETIRILFFVALAMIAFHSYPITAVMVILLALLNDLPILAIAFDRTWLDPRPVRWQLRRVLTVATVLGMWGVFQSFVVLALARAFLPLDGAQLQSLIYLKLAVAGHLTLFITRARGPFWAPPRPAPALLGAILVTQSIAVLVVGFGWLMAPVPWWIIAALWGYALLFMVLADRIKLAVYRILDGARGADMLHRWQERLHPQAGS